MPLSNKVGNNVGCMDCFTCACSHCFVFFHLFSIIRISPPSTPSCSLCECQIVLSCFRLCLHAWRSPGFSGFLHSACNWPPFVCFGGWDCCCSSLISSPVHNFTGYLPRFSKNCLTHLAWYRARRTSMCRMGQRITCWIFYCIIHYMYCIITLGVLKSISLTMFCFTILWP